MGKAARILVVEDHDSTRVALRRILEYWGYAVREASVREDVAAARSWRPRVVLLDLALPRLDDGWEVARDIRDWPGPPPFLIAITGHGGPLVQAKAAELGFDADLLKPCNEEELHRLVEHGALPDISHPASARIR
jgi:CheY-like chemotaxis protein